MELNNLRPAKGSTHSEKRIGRGQGSGHGGTSTRGHKGDKARSGHKNKRGFEGGQTPMQRRLPKRGFKNPFRVEYIPFNLAQLQACAEKYGVTEITPAFLYEKGYIQRDELVKILGNGQINSALTVSAHGCSEAAKAAIEAAGGSITVV
ncbi:MAG: 50S ribosomal protein L15 [Saprospiraceae bacterium]|nr:50S ribosomal protein L15 [Saprospiraceae bacterium]